MNIDFAKSGGLVPAIAQDADTGQVLMLAWMNREAYEETVRTGRACYFSRSRGRLWRKGEESGNVQEVRQIQVDCDADTILLKVRQIGGAACHEGYPSCFFRRVEGDRQEHVRSLLRVLAGGEPARGAVAEQLAAFLATALAEDQTRELRCLLETMIARAGAPEGPQRRQEIMQALREIFPPPSAAASAGTAPAPPRSAASR